MPTIDDLLQELDRERTLRREAEEKLRAAEQACALAEQQLRESSSRMTRLISNMQSAVLLEDEHGKVLVANDMFRDMFGLTAGEFQTADSGDVCWSIFSLRHLFPDPAAFEARMRQLVHDRQPMLNEILETTGRSILSLDFIPFEVDGQNKGHLWRYTDITGSRQMEQQLKAQRLFYEQILNEIPADIVVFDNKHRYKFINPISIGDAVLRKWLIGKTDEDYCLYRNKPLSIAEKRRELFNAVVAARVQKEWEEKLIRPDGTVEYHLRKMYPVFDAEGKLDIVIGYCVNITARINAEEALRRSEEKYRGIIENMNLGMVELDEEGRIRSVNHSFCQSSGYDANELNGVIASDLFLRGRSKGMFQRGLRAHAKGMSEVYNLAVKNKRGELKWWHVSAAPIYNKENEFIGSVAVQLDITQQKMLEQQLREAKQDAEQSAMAKEAFLANISHEIRTPMNAIIGLGRLMLKTPLNEVQMRYLTAIQTAADNLLVIINDVLDFSKIEAGKLTIEHIGFSMEDMVRHALYVMRHKAEEKGIALKLFTDPLLADVHIGDPYRINQVLLNLLSNAIKFTEKGSVQVQCMVQTSDSGYQLLCLKVIDTGIGMSEEYKTLIFEKFSQEDASITRKFGGTGLGMSISRQLIDLMGGQMEVESEKNVGTTISIYLTLPIGSQSDIPKREEVIVEQHGLKGKEILLVEDNELNRFVASTMLEQYGAVITSAENGQIALDLLEERSFDIVLMDMQMPVMDGIEATIQIRKRFGRRIPIIALTANALKGEQERCFDAGMNDYIVKPFEEEKMVRLIAHWLGQDVTLKPKQESMEVSGPLYDLSKLRAMARGNEAFITRMLELFHKEIPESVAKIDQAFADKDLPAVRAFAHRIKPSVQNMAIASLKDTVPKIEQLAQAGDPDNELPPLIDRLKKMTALVIADIEEKLKAAPSAT